MSKSRLSTPLDPNTASELAWEAAKLAGEIAGMSDDEEVVFVACMVIARSVAAESGPAKTLAAETLADAAFEAIRKANEKLQEATNV